MRKLKLSNITQPVSQGRQKVASGQRGSEAVARSLDTGKLSATLSELFQRRMENHEYRYDLKDRIDLPEEKRIQRTVFIKAPRSIAYGEVAKVIDGIRGAGVEPVGLQIDELD